MSHKIILMIYLSLFFGCAQVYLPEQKMLHSIEASSYNKEENNCGHKSIKYANYLNTYGGDAYVIVGKINGVVEPHARVIIRKEGKEYLVDPTWTDFPSDGFEVERYSEFTPWAIFKKGVTWDDLRHYRKIIKLYSQNIPDQWKPFFMYYSTMHLSKPKKLSDQELKERR